MAAGFRRRAGSAWWWAVVCLLAECSLLALPAVARTWEVGPERALASPEQVAALVTDGDRVVFDAGVYRHCAIWRASRLTIEARLPPAGMNQTVMTQPMVTGPPCADRGLFVFFGNDITVRGLTFAHARDSWHTGAGILMEGANLTVQNSQFLDNENGILAAGTPSSVVRIEQAVFRGNGSCAGACAHALYVGKRIARLELGVAQQQTSREAQTASRHHRA